MDDSRGKDGQVVRIIVYPVGVVIIIITLDNKSDTLDGRDLCRIVKSLRERVLDHNVGGWRKVVLGAGRPQSLLFN